MTTNAASTHYQQNRKNGKTLCYSDLRASHPILTNPTVSLNWHFYDVTNEIRHKQTVLVNVFNSLYNTQYWGFLKCQL